MIVKQGANIRGMHIAMRQVLAVADTIWKDAGQELVVTAGVDNGGHSAGSLHYFGRAVDLRTRYFDEETKQRVFHAMKTSLKNPYQTILEPDHIHVEYDTGE